VQLSTDAHNSAQIAVTAKDLAWRMGYAEVQVLPPLAAGSDHLAAAITTSLAGGKSKTYFLLDLVDELDLSEILIPAQAKDPRGEKGFDPRM